MTLLQEPTFCLSIRDIDGREVAVRGFLNVLDDLLAELKQNGASSQAESVAFEILGKHRYYLLYKQD